MALDLETRGQLIDTVRRFVTERLRPLEAQVAENDAVPDEIIAEMRAGAYINILVPELRSADDQASATSTSP